ncbi:MAG TPA: cytochrome c nitrite reductase small subunit [Candidatus Sumerlaeota bacterium]|nr:cytochrome c nitrite reductase small subunit [Candidatus Sumerlaeota bacterium]HPS02678.1 cytochrome c nitrite reductase small subunit [Candidatus Sumerlaeota bacterium]
MAIFMDNSDPRSSPRKSGLVLLLLGASVLAAGVLAGVGAFTFGYANGLSYLRRDPEGCANCHVMQDYYDTWLKSSHHAVAVCVDCHLPHDLAGKYVVKADNGFFHSKAFTLNNFHEPIQIKPRNRRIAQKNCLVCHKDIVQEMLPESPQGEAPTCVHCHTDVGHRLR